MIMNLLKQFDNFLKHSDQSPEVLGVRAKAANFLKTRGLPTRKDDEWKYTSLKILNDESFLPAQLETPQPSHDTIQKIQNQLSSEFINIVFHNGVLNKTLSALDELPSGVRLDERTCKSLSEREFADSFEALNAVYSEKFYTLEVAPDTAISRPLQFLFFSSLEQGPAIIASPNVTVNIGDRASLSLFESYEGQEDARYFVNSQFDLNIAESAKVSHVRVQTESKRAINIGRTNVFLGSNSSLHTLAYATGSLLAHYNLRLTLKSVGASAIVDGACLVRGEQHLDNVTVIDHAIGGCSTSQHYKGVVADRARTIFNGKVIIQKQAQKANSQQLNNNLLLSREAEANSRPQLEIYADDVKASHGSTIGQLNREELFYLESRAISPALAVPMMSLGYLSELIYKIENEQLQKWLSKKLHDAFIGIKVDLA